MTSTEAAYCFHILSPRSTGAAYFLFRAWRQEHGQEPEEGQAQEEEREQEQEQEQEPKEGQEY